MCETGSLTRKTDSLTRMGDIPERRQRGKWASEPRKLQALKNTEFIYAENGDLSIHGLIAQLGERQTEDLKVSSSILD